MRLADHVHALPLSFSIGDRQLTVHPVAIETPRGLLLLDAGMPGGRDTLASGLDDAGLALADVTYLVLTHQDPDHAGCARAVADAVDPAVFAHEADAPYIEGERPPIKAHGDDRPYRPVPVDVRLRDREAFRTDAGPLVAVHTPGHTPGHLSFFLPETGLLLSADALNNRDGLVGPRTDATPDVETARESVATLAELDVERVHCFHGGPTDEGRERIAELAAR